MQHSFSVEVATKYGVNVAIFLNNLVFWVQHNKANEKHFHKDRYWVYNTSDALAILFPYWSTDQIDRLIKKCVSTGLVVLDNFNKTKYDRTRWFGLTDHAMELLHFSIPRNRGRDSAKSNSSFREIAGPIPDIKPDIKPDKREELPLFFEPDKQNQELANRLGVDICSVVQELKSKKPALQWSQALLAGFIKSAAEVKNERIKNEPRSIVKDFEPSSWSKPLAKPETIAKHMDKIKSSLKGYSHGCGTDKQGKGSKKMGRNGQTIPNVPIGAGSTTQ